ncbi:aromatic acid/H+ symport family MFS transporter [Streptomyces sp. SKN60]|uniref:MFS transporter n=1 Tax=Streptomyces sp. SKN60 TaxID=2855506 RepID=UPI002246B39E|nr:aromatic acid/H+ symport family MFS transporter [Streptomyces sp. SKN60]MCX2181900.1 aromatic acid/H+ symport family MFS transporter [Streptomyces sp. SKN60]
MSTAKSGPVEAAAPWRPAALVIGLCWLIVVFDGYDLIVYGTTIPALLKEPGWQLTPGQAGTIGSLAFAGMLVGALFAGNLADRLGRRRTILACVTWFTLFTGLCGLAPNAEVFGVLRFVAGLGLGGLVPSANALAAEFVPARFRSVGATAMMSGVPIGGALAAIIGIPTLPALGWEALYLFAFSGFLLVAALGRWLPESAVWLRSKNRVDEARAVETRYGLGAAEDDTNGATTGTAAPAYRPALSTVLRPPFLPATLLFGAATVATLFAWYGLGTWLPKLTASEPRFDLGSDPLTYLLALNLGAVAGSAITAWVATRIGPLRSAIIAAACAAIGLASLVTYPSSILVVYGALILAGVGTHGTQCLIISAVAGHYPPILRGTALGFALGAGRIGAVIAPTTAGWLLDGGYGVSSNFLLFAGASALSAVLLVAPYLLTRSARTAEPAGALAQ